MAAAAPTAKIEARNATGNSGQGVITKHRSQYGQTEFCAYPCASFDDSSLILAPHQGPHPSSGASLRVRRDVDVAGRYGQVQRKGKLSR